MQSEPGTTINLLTPVRDNRIKEIRQRVKKASAGPWSGGERYNHVRSETAGLVLLVDKATQFSENKQYFKDFDFVVHSRQDISFLLEIVSGLTKALDKSHDPLCRSYGDNRNCFPCMALGRDIRLPSQREHQEEDMSSLKYRGKCQVTEKTAGKFYDCDIPTDYKCAEAPYWWVCKDHAIYATVAGWQPEKVPTETEVLGEAEDLGSQDD